MRIEQNEWRGENEQKNELTKGKRMSRRQQNEQKGRMSRREQNEQHGRIYTEQNEQTGCFIQSTT